MTFAFNALGNDGINLLAISLVTTVLSVMKGRVYEKYASDIDSRVFFHSQSLPLLDYNFLFETRKHSKISDLCFKRICWNCTTDIHWNYCLSRCSSFIIYFLVGKWYQAISSKSFRKEQCRYYKRKARFR